MHGGGAAGLVVALDDHSTQADVSVRGLEAGWHSVQEFLDDQLFLYSDNAVIRTGHADVRDVGGALREHSFICRGNVRVGANHRSGPSIQVPAKGDFLRAGFGVEIHKYDFRFDLFQQTIDITERVVAGAHEDASLKIDYGIADTILL